MKTCTISELNPPCLVNLDDESATMALGAAIAELLPKGGVVKLHGDLGAGKTTLVRGLLKSLGLTGNVKSPTYTLVEPYQLNGRDIYHFDLYRLGDPEELEYLGIRDYFAEGVLCLIEWPEKGDRFIPDGDLSVNLIYNEQSRTAKINTP